MPIAGSGVRLRGVRRTVPHDMPPRAGLPSAPMTILEVDYGIPSDDELARLRAGERIFILSAGLKGAVPILLGEFLRAAHVPQAERLYGIVVVVVALSVLVQGSSVPALARALKVPMRMTAPEPWTVGVRLRDEPEGVHRLTVSKGSAADGATVESLSDQAGDIWVSIVVRESGLVAVRADTELQAGDEVVVLAEPELVEQLSGLFRG